MAYISHDAPDVLTRHFRPTPFPVILALAMIGACLAFAMMQEPPIGSLSGQVIMSDNFRPLDNVEISLTPTSGDINRKTRRVISGIDGQFRINNLLAGEYMLNAYSDNHNCGGIPVQIYEGQQTISTISLLRSAPDLTVTRHQRVFSVSEKVDLPVRGYIDWRKPIGQDHIEVSLYKTQLSQIMSYHGGIEALLDINSNLQTPQSLPNILKDNPRNTPPILILHKMVRITRSDQEGFYTQNLHFDRPGPGVYLVDITHGKQHASSWLLVTDLALISKRTASSALLWAVNISSGSPIPNTNISAWAEGKNIQSITANSDGIGHMTIPFRKWNQKKILFIARRGMDEAVIGSDINNYEEMGSFTAAAYTDRPIYRPGQRIYYKAVIRKNINPGIKYSVPSGQKVNVELRDPTGVRIMQQTQLCNAFGTIHGSANLSVEAPTGVYSLILTIGEEKHTHDVVIASYKKPEFEVTVTPEKKRYVRGDIINTSVKARYYFGTPVSGAKIKWSVYRNAPWDMDMDSGDANYPYSSYFQNMNDTGYGEIISEGNTRLDNNGEANIQFSSIPKKDNERSSQLDNSAFAPDSYQYSIDVTVTEPSGREVDEIAQTQVTASDYHISLNPDGYLAYPGKPFHIQAILKNYDGKPIANRNVILKYGYERWIATNSGFNTDLYLPAGAIQATTNAAGLADIFVTPIHNGMIRLAASAQDIQGRTTHDVDDIYCTDDSGDGIPISSADLTLFPDKKRYVPGDTARILLTSSRQNQTVLLTIEGNKINKVILIKLHGHSAVTRLPILSEYGPNVFLDACYINHKSYASSEMPLQVSMQNRQIIVKVTPDRPPSPTRPGHLALPAYNPGDKVAWKIKTTDTHGNPLPCEVSLGVVDEAIYALREDDPRALPKSFYPYRNNSVLTEFSFSIEYLGDSDKSEPLITARKRFPDTAFWLPDINTNSAGLAAVQFRLPDNLTTWRATVIANSKDSRFGRQIAKILTYKQFFVRLEAPRFLTQKDETRFLTLVHNDTALPQTALVHLQASGLTIQGTPIRSVDVPAGGIGKIEWKVTAAGLIKSSIRVTAWTPAKKESKQWTDGIETSIPILPFAREVVRANAGTITSASPASETVYQNADAIQELSKMTIRITPSLFACMDSSLDYLTGYPYGCTEQTLSRFIPDILAEAAMKKYGLQLPAGRRAMLPGMIRDSLTRLYRYQHSSGGWGWWQHDQDNVWITGYALYGLAQAQRHGYPVSAIVLSRARKAGIKMLASLYSVGLHARPKSTPNDFYASANAELIEYAPILMYGLLQAGERQTVENVRTKYPLERANAKAAAWISLVDALLSKPDKTALIMQSHAHFLSGMLYYSSANESENDDALETTAVQLKAILTRNPNDPRIDFMLRWLVSRRQGECWESTWDTSLVLDALCEYLSKKPQKLNAGGFVKMLLNGKVIHTWNISPDMSQIDELIYQAPTSQLMPGENNIQFVRGKGNLPVFYSIITEQFVPITDEPGHTASTITVKREYDRISTGQFRPGDQWYLPVEPTNNLLKNGDNIRVTLHIHNPMDASYVLIEDPFPAGCEVQQRGTIDDESWSFWYSNVDVRDNKVAFFAAKMPHGDHTLSYILHAQTNGTYHVMPSLVQGMYTPSTRAESAENIIVIR
jgi:uncharacterized protein YfaS (alpha-2-macroglobulin family)